MALFLKVANKGSGETFAQMGLSLPRFREKRLILQTHCKEPYMAPTKPHLITVHA